MSKASTTRLNKEQLGVSTLQGIPFKQSEQVNMHGGDNFEESLMTPKDSFCLNNSGWSIWV